MRSKRFLTPKHRQRVLQQEKYQRQQLQAMALQEALDNYQPPDPEPEPTALDQAYELARQVYVDHPDQKMMRRLDNGLALARSGKVTALGQKVFDVNGYTVDQKCTCQDYYWNSSYSEGWCKHRLAVALTLKADTIKKEKAERAGVQPQRKAGPAKDPNTQANCSTDFDLAQVAGFRPLWGGAPGTGVNWPEGGYEVLDHIDFNLLSARAEALGWKSCGNEMYLNPEHEIHKDERM